VRLLIKTQKVLHLAHLLHVSSGRTRVHYTGSQNCIRGKEEKTGYFVESRRGTTTKKDEAFIEHS